MDPRDGGTSAYSIYGLGRWTGGRPIIWIRTGAALAALGYAVVVTYSVAIGIGPFHSRVLEGFAAVVSAAAWWLAPRRPTVAASLVIGSIALETLLSLVTATHVGALSSLLVVLVLVMASGLFLGERAVAPATAAGAVLVPVALSLSQRYGAWLERLPPYDAARLLVFEVCVVGTGFMTWLTIRTFNRVLAAAEERRRLELHLQHLQRLEMIGSLASGFAHDLKNVLSVAGGVAGVLERHPDPAVRDAATDLDRACASGASAVRHLLDVARREEPERVVLDVADGVGRLRRMATRLVGPNHALELHAAGPAPALLDPLELEQLVLNLVANARDATPDGGTVSLAVRPLDRKEAAQLGSTLAAAQQVLVEVRDDGPGVPPELQARIFEPWFTSKPRGHGTGLGLSTVRAIATASGGGVALSSAAGAGAAFRVFLPVEPQAAVDGRPGRPVERVG
ncbi:MAG TPA: ATP-binding protein [Anaeromyxobacter sp.]|nr:ATP-binding protein [Anaeromyxobacter sp.]